MAIGGALGVAILAWLYCQQWSSLQMIGTWKVVGVGTALYAPTLIQPFVQRKSFKIVSRFLLGLAVPCLWFGAMVLLPWDTWGWTLRVVFVMVFWQTYRVTQWFRARFASNPCTTCLNGVFPFCQDNRQRLVALVGQLQARARPEDQAFVDFAAHLAGLKDIGVEIEITSLQMALHSPSERKGACESCSRQS